jgi:hypothetical protein
MIANWDGNDLEPFVAADVAAKFLCITRRRVLEMARAGQLPAHPIAHGKRKQWRFRLSELATSLLAEKPDRKGLEQGIIGAGSPRQPNRRN